MSKSDLIDLTLALHHETDRAILVSETGDEKKAKWIPKSQCEVEPTTKFCTVGLKRYPIVIVSMPEWQAINKELV